MSVEVILGDKRYIFASEKEAASFLDCVKGGQLKSYCATKYPPLRIENIDDELKPDDSPKP